MHIHMVHVAKLNRSITEEAREQEREQLDPTIGYEKNFIRLRCLLSWIAPLDGHDDVHLGGTISHKHNQASTSIAC